MAAVKETIEDVKKLEADKYKYGFTTDIEQEFAPKGLNEETVRFISAKKGEPEWMTEWRLEALRRFKTMDEPTWARVHYPKIDFEELYYYAAPKSVEGVTLSCRTLPASIGDSSAAVTCRRARPPTSV